MLTLNSYGNNANRNDMLIWGLSTDIKPTGEFEGISIENGSILIEMDTKKVFVYDCQNKLWREFT